MTREDVIRNLMNTYAQYGVRDYLIETEIESGLERGFSYQTIYTGLRMALGKCYDVTEHFTVADIAEAFGVTEEEIIEQLKQLDSELKENGEDTSKYFTRVNSKDRQRFVIMPGGLK